jgi:hypothetical protein
MQNGFLTIGLDIAKSVFQVHGVDANGLVVVRRQFEASLRPWSLRNLGPCLVGVFIGVGVQYCIDVPIDTASDRSAADGPRRIEHNERNRPDRQTCAELDELRQLCLLAHGRD